MNKKTRWLLAEIDRWKAEGVVSAEQAQRLRERYPDEDESLGTVIFAAAGAVIGGLGVILLIAYNWDEIPKPGKLALVFAALLGSHIAGLVLQRSADWRHGFGAALSLLGTMFFGAGIWLVAQIYHIDEHYPTGFLIWAIGALAMAWALESVLQALLATVLFAIWGSCEVFSFRDPNLWALPIVVVAIAPLTWRRKSAVLLAVLLVAVNVLLLTNLGSLGSGRHVLTAAFALGALLLGLARLAEQNAGRFPSASGLLAFFGYAGAIGCAYLLSFRWSWHALVESDFATPGDQTVALVHSWVVFGLALCVWALLVKRAMERRLGGFPAGEWLVPLALAYTYAVVWGRWPVLLRLGAHPFNLMLLGLAAAWMWRGCREAQVRATVLGSLLLAALVAARYFDLFESLAWRGFTFVVLGVVLATEAIYYRRRRLQLRAAAAP